MSEWQEGDYPTDAALDKIGAWPITTETDALAVLAFFESIWWAADWGWRSFDGEDRVLHQYERIYLVSTGGWSGNESLIEAMKENFFLWSMTWYSVRRGGHYEFRVRLAERGTPAERAGGQPDL